MAAAAEIKRPFAGMETGRRAASGARVLEKIHYSEGRSPPLKLRPWATIRGFVGWSFFDFLSFLVGFLVAILFLLFVMMGGLGTGAPTCLAAEVGC